MSTYENVDWELDEEEKQLPQSGAMPVQPKRPPPPEYKTEADLMAAIIDAETAEEASLRVGQFCIRMYRIDSLALTKARCLNRAEYHRLMAHWYRQRMEVVSGK
ncbi:hypothetical protein MRS76_18595 [Rhizobiaceae bacterium n13]|uniref:Uncharacterized protein n=1 Tax=Ferirhizobium litorale TaxID=2927786 RepID=A0AAE3U2K0_9HYPH|nr:hypothetical protein [Fererhizobium litorale]MDI7863963.1 hypothetical protein [Fererhizobium litorale]MDI7924204.1 hypothetical protein [Fererhizobium litorale]